MILLNSHIVAEKAHCNSKLSFMQLLAVDLNDITNGSQYWRYDCLVSYNTDMKKFDWNYLYSTFATVRHANLSKIVEGKRNKKI